MPFVKTQQFIVTQPVVQEQVSPKHPRSAQDQLQQRHQADCNIEEQREITAAFRNIAAVQVPKIRALGGACVNLANCLVTKTVDNVNISCQDDNGEDGATYDLKTGILTVYRYRFPVWINALEPNIFHELVHACGGNDIDCYALEYYLYFGSRNPDPTILDICCRNGFNVRDLWTYKGGKPLAWEPHPTGYVWVWSHVWVSGGTDTVAYSQNPILRNWHHPCPP